MQFIFAFVYNFLLVFLALTFLLLVFAFRRTRKLLHSFQTKFQNVLNNPYAGYLLYFSFAIISLILIDSLTTYFSLTNHFKDHEHSISSIGIERLDITSHTGSNENIIGVLKQIREFYLAERNIMLSCSALFVYFVFNRLLYSIRKLADQEHRQENPSAKSVILEDEPDFAMSAIPDPKED